MISDVQTEARPPQILKPGQRYHATIGRYDDPEDRATMDSLSRWVEDYFAADLKERPSKHVYIRKLPPEIRQQMDTLRDNPVVYEAILRQFPPGSIISPMKHTDELYISHYNKDYGGDQGLYSKHYDGNLRFLSYGCVVRSLIYLQSDASYKVVFGDSQVEKAFVTYDFGILDFHRELHWVEGEYNPNDKQRILLKCNYMVSPPHGGLVKRAVMGMNTSVFYVVKAAMEYSKSPKTLPQRFVGLICNLFRLMNNVHPFVPFLFILLVISLIVGGVVWLVS